MNMKSIIDYDEKAVNIQPRDGVLLVDHKNLIKSAIEKEITWNTLACFLTDFVLSPDKLKDIIKTLVQELQTWVAKVENKIGSEKIGVSETCFVIKDTEHDEEHFSGDFKENDFVESYEMYLADETPETQAMEFPENFESKNTHDDHESKAFETSNQVTILEESKSFASENSTNVKQLGNKNFECDICHKSFNFRSKLIRHQHLHTGVKPYHCKFCIKQFSLLHHLQVHERIHTGEKPYKCSKCKKAFTQSQDLKRHQRKHTGERPHNCTMCDKSFFQSGDLKSHFTRRHSISCQKTHKCNMCGKCFMKSQELKSHTRQHTGEKPYQCDLCEKSFAQVSNLKRHQKIIHSNKN